MKPKYYNEKIISAWVRRITGLYMYIICILYSFLTLHIFAFGRKS